MIFLKTKGKKLTNFIFLQIRFGPRTGNSRLFDWPIDKKLKKKFKKKKSKLPKGDVIRHDMDVTRNEELALEITYSIDRQKELLCTGKTFRVSRSFYQW